MRISDWRSDVCSSDLAEQKEQAKARAKVGDDAPGPTEIRTELVRTELIKASVWIGLALLVGACIILVQPILLIFAGIVMASMLDGGTRLLGRVLPIARGWRLLIVCLAILAFLAWTGKLGRASCRERVCQ